MNKDPYGVTLERFAAYAFAAYGRPEAELPDLARAHGIPAEHLQDVVAQWDRLLRSDRDLAVRYSELYQNALVAAGVQRPDITFEQYVEMIRAVAARTPVDQVCARYGMSIQQWAMVNDYWGKQMVQNPQLAMRYVNLVGYTAR